MQDKSVPAFLAGFGCVAMVAAYFLTFSPSTENIQSALSLQNGKEGAVQISDIRRNTCSKVQYNDMRAIQSDKYPVYKCSFNVGSNADNSKADEGYFYKRDNAWVFARTRPELTSFFAVNEG